MAVKLLTETIAYRVKHALRLAEGTALAERGRRYHALGRDHEAILDLEKSIKIVETSSDLVSGRALRDTYLSGTQNAYENLASIYLERSDPSSAFVTADRERSGAILRTEGIRIPDVREFQSRLSKGTLVLHFTSSESRLFIAALEHDDWEAIQIAEPRIAITALRDRFIAAIDKNDLFEIDRLSKTLYRLLVAPVESRLAGVRSLVIIPDETTTSVPFAALRGSDDRWLVQRFPIAYSPAAATFRGESELNTLGRVTILADPAFDTTLFDLPRLLAARNEITTLAKTFKRTTILEGKAATPAEAVRAFQESDAIHVATHAVVNTRDGSKSFLLLAGPSISGLLYQGTIAELRLTGTKFVMLAGCRTAIYGGGRGSIRSLSQAFLASGVRSTLGTLWDVSDDATSRMTKAFYHVNEHLHLGSAAIREAQVKAIAQRQPARNWAGFQLFVAN